MIKIIGISGNMGAGKTTLAKTLASELNATYISWDTFDEISSGPDDYVDWYRRGENYTEWNYQVLADVLKALKQNQTVIHPVLKNTMHPTSYIIFDAPLGRLHQQTGRYIDLWIHIQVPLDISLCRHLLRDFKDNDKTKEELLEELEYYLSYSRPLFLDDALKKQADLNIDGILKSADQVKIIKDYLVREKL